MSFLIALHIACSISAVFVYAMKGCRNIKRGYLHCLLYAPIIIPSEAVVEGALLVYIDCILDLGSLISSLLNYY